MFCVDALLDYVTLMVQGYCVCSVLMFCSIVLTTGD